MAVLGNNVEGGSTFSASPGRKVSGKFNLAGEQMLQELHAFVHPGSAGGGDGNTYVIHVYADSSGSPGALVAYTSPIVLPGGSVVVEISQTGFATALAAGDYWLGLTLTTDRGDIRCAASGGTLKAILGGATVSPPSDPYGSTDFSGAQTLSVWAVVGAAVSAGPVALPSIPSLAEYDKGVSAKRATTGAPVNLVAPFVSGTAETGEVLSCNGGSWSGAATIVLTYQWKRAGVSIGSATNSTYTLVALDENVAILCTVTATNGSGNASQNSNSVTPTSGITRVPLQSATSLSSATLLYSDGIDI